MYQATGAKKYKIILKINNLTSFGYPYIDDAKNVQNKTVF